MFSSFINGLKNIKAWWHVLKNDNDYDFLTIYLILKFKLEQLYNTLSNAPIADIEPELQRIDYCIGLCDQLINDDFCEKEFKHHDAKWGKIEVKTEKIENSKNLRAEFIRPFANTEEEKKQEDEEFSKICMLEAERRQKAILSLFLTIANNHRKWWF